MPRADIRDAGDLLDFHEDISYYLASDAGLHFRSIILPPLPPGQPFTPMDLILLEGEPFAEDPGFFVDPEDIPDIDFMA